MKTRKGFTLIELLITVGIMALLVAFSIPTYQLLVAQQQLNSAVDQVEEYVRLTQQKTVTEQQLYGLTFVANATTVTQFRYNPINSQKTTIEVYTLPINIKIGQVNLSGQSDIHFSTAGSPDFSGSVVLNDTIRNRNRSILIKPSGSINSNQSEN